MTHHFKPARGRSAAALWSVTTAAIALTLAFAGCGLLGPGRNGDGQPSDSDPPPGSESVPAAAAVTATAAAPAAPKPPLVPPSVDTLDLDRDEVALLIDIFRALPDPCKAQANLLESLHKGGCDLTAQLSSYAVRGIQKGYGKEQMTGMLAREARRLTAVIVVDTTGAPSVGPADAKVKVVLFSDFECPYCRKVVAPTRKMQEHYGFWLAFKHFPLRNHAFAEPAARAAWAAQQQGKFWPAHDKFFEHNDKLDEDSLKAYAKELGLDVERFARDQASDAAKAAVKRDRGHGEAAGLDGTPTFFVNGREAHTPEQVQGAVRKALKALGVPSIPARLSF